MQATRSSKNMGFTIVELLIVIVVIGILAAISIVSYSGVSKQAVVTTIKSDLDGSRKQIEMFEIEKGVYPETIDCSQPTTEKNTCLPLSGGNVVSYYRAIDDGATKSYYLTITNGANSYNITNSTPIDVGIITPKVANPTKTCPTGYVKVPGNGALGTPNDFCVMKYEAKSTGSAVVSQPGLQPIGSTTQLQAITLAASACGGCRLISEPEWLTVANNLFYVGSNWSGGEVGSGYMYTGHNDKLPSQTLAVSDENDGYSDTLNESTDIAKINGMVGKSQRRTLNLSNGEVIWDFSGNVAEITSGTITNQPGLESDDFFSRSKEWSNPSLVYRGLPQIAVPPSGYGSASGIGQLSSSAIVDAERVYLRGGAYNSYAAAGIYSLNFSMGTDVSLQHSGFRSTCDPS